MQGYGTGRHSGTRIVDAARADTRRRMRALPSGRAHRLLAVDLARTSALFGMVVFHLVRDLEIFGMVPQGTTLTGGWAIFARLIAGTFIFLSGVSLVLAHGEKFRTEAWLRRTSTVFVAAFLVSAATFIAFPEQFVFFGILHAIAFFALLGPGLLRLPAWCLAAGAVGVLAVSSQFGRVVFDAVYLAWTGLGATVPASLDFIPVFPWLATYLLGMAAARMLPRDMLAIIPPTSAWKLLAAPGRHSLAIYLIHQPVLFAILWIVSKAL